MIIKNLLLVVMTSFITMTSVAPTVPVYAGTETSSEQSENKNTKSPNGVWYGSPYGVDMRLKFYVDEDEKNVYVRDKMKNGISEYGTWKLDGDTLILDEGNNVEMTFDYKENEMTSTVNGIHYRFTREKEEKEEIKEKENIKIKDFDGKWMADEITSGTVTADLKTFKVGDISLDIKNGAVDMSVNSNFLQKPLRKYDIKADMVGNYMVFNLNLVGDKNCEAICSLLEDDSLSVEFQTPELKLNVSFSKDKEK